MDTDRPDFTADQLATILHLDLQYGNPMSGLMEQMMTAQKAQLAQLAPFMFGEQAEGGNLLDSILPKLQVWLANLWARRLLADQRFMPLVSSNDLVNAVSELQAQLVADDPELAAEAHTLQMQEMVSALAEQVMGWLGDMVGDQSKVYDHLWKRVDEIVAVAAQEGAAPEALLQTQEGRDALVRSRVTADEFITQIREQLAQMPDPEAVKAQMQQAQGMLGDLLQMLGDDAGQFGQMFDNLGPSLASMRDSIRNWGTETVYRIWHFVPEL